MKKIVLTILWCFLLTCSFSQNTEVKNKPDGLEIIAGNWAVKAETRLSANGPWENSSATSVISKVVGGTVLEEDFTGSRKGKPFITKTLLAVNNLTGKIQRVFMDSEHGGTLGDFEGQKEKENTFVFDKLWTYPNGNTVKLRVVYTILSDNEFQFESMRMTQNTSTWDVTSKIRYTRKK